MTTAAKYVKLLQMFYVFFHLIVYKIEIMNLTKKTKEEMKNETIRPFYFHTAADRTVLHGMRRTIREKT